MLLVETLHFLLLAGLLGFLALAWSSTLRGRTASAAEPSAGPRRARRLSPGGDERAAPVADGDTQVLSSPPAALCRLEILDGPQRGEVLRLATGALPAVIGRRSRGNQPGVGLRDEEAHRRISRRQALIERHEEGFQLVDESSANGTWLNGRRLQPGRRHPLQDGDEISLANEIRLRFQVERE